MASGGSISLETLEVWLARRRQVMDLFSAGVVKPGGDAQGQTVAVPQHRPQADEGGYCPEVLEAWAVHTAMMWQVPCFASVLPAVPAYCSGHSHPPTAASASGGWRHRPQSETGPRPYWASSGPHLLSKGGSA